MYSTGVRGSPPSPLPPPAVCLTSLLYCCPIQHVPNLVTGIHTIGQRVIVSDVQESLFWVRYRRNENQLIIFADDTYPRWVTTACLLDYDTMASADKFGNISIVNTLTRSVVCVRVCVYNSLESNNKRRIYLPDASVWHLELNNVFPFIFISQVRLPPNTSDDVDEDPTGNKALWDRGLLNGASQKVTPSVL